MKIPSPRPALQWGRSVVQRGHAVAWRIGLLLVLGGVAAGTAHAAGEGALCVLPPPGQTVTLEQLDAVALDCLKSAEYFQLRGRLELAARQPEAALVSFERALLIDPDHVGTQVDYAQTLIAVRDEPSAAELIRQILARDDVPSRVRPQLERQLQAITEAAEPARAVATGAIREAVAEADPWFHRVSLSQAFGYDSNLNNAFSLSSLVLTGPQGNVELEVDRDFRPQRGGTAVTALQWIGLRPAGQSLWIAQADLRNRHTASNEHRYVQGDVALSWLQAPEASSQWIFRLAQSYVLRAGRPLYDSRLGSGQRQWTANRCRIGAGLEVEGRRYLQSEVLDGTYRGLAFSLLCPGGAADSLSTVANAGAVDGPLWGLGGVSLSMRLGVDRPSDGDRAGGEQRAGELRARWQGAWASTNLQLEYVWQRQLDESGYSALLSNGAVRRITRNSLRLEASRPLPFWTQSRTQVFGTAEFSRQRSNLQLFDVTQAAVMVGLRWALQ